MSEHAINGFMGISMEKIRSMVDSNTMIGNPIVCGDGTTVIPVSKVAIGFASGGSDLPTRTAKEYFAGGAGAGLSVKPLGFLTVKDGEVKFINVPSKEEKGGIVDQIPALIEKLSAMIPKKGKKDAEETAEDADSIAEVVEE